MMGHWILKKLVDIEIWLKTWLSSKKGTSFKIQLFLGRGDDQVVSVLVLYFVDTSFNPT